MSADPDAQAFFRSFVPQPGETTIEEWDEYGFHIRRTFRVDASGLEVLESEEITVGVRP